MLVRDLIQAVLQRAGLEGDPFYNDEDEILRAIQTAYDTYHNALLAQRPAELELIEEVTPYGSTIVPLPDGCMVVRSLMREDTKEQLPRVHRLDFGSAFPCYDFDSNYLYLNDPAAQLEPLVLIYLPHPKKLTRDSPINERLFPENGIVLSAITELLAKDSDPRAQLYAQQSQQYFQIWLGSIISARLCETNDAHASVVSIINQVLQANNRLKPDYATQHAVLSFIQQAIDRIHRGIEVVAESTLRNKFTIDAPYPNPKVVNLPQDCLEVLLVIIRVGASWFTAAHGEVATHPATTRSGAYYYSIDNTTNQISIFWPNDQATPSAIEVSYLTKAPVLTMNSIINTTLYPRDLIVNYATAQLAEDDNKRIQLLAVFEQTLQSFSVTLRERYIQRGQLPLDTRAGIIAAVRGILGSSRDGEWRDQLIEQHIDLVKEEIARYIRNTFQGFNEVVKEYTLSSRVTSFQPSDTWLQIIQIMFAESDDKPYEVVKADSQSHVFRYVKGLYDNRDQALIFSGDGLGPGKLFITMVTPPSFITGNYSGQGLSRLLYPPDVIVAKTVERIINSPGVASPELAQSGGYWNMQARLLLAEHVASLNSIFRREKHHQRLAIPVQTRRRLRPVFI